MDANATNIIGPADGQVTAVSVSGTATAAAAIPYVSTPLGRVLVLQAIAADVNVVFGLAGMDAPTLTANSLRVLQTQGQVRMIPPPGATHMRTIATGAGTLLVAPGSP